MKNKGKVVCNRLSIDVEPEEHQKIKLFATIQGTSIKNYVLNSIRERLEREEKESEEKQLLAMTNQITPVLKKVWDNDKDEIYNEL
jgi:uncharacterized protein (DUF1778 family)